MSDDEGDGDADATDEQPTVTIGSEGFQPDAEETTTAGLENAVPDADGAFDWRGWLLVAVVAVSFLALPVFVTLRPLQVVDFRTTYLLLPLLPAVLLGATAVWVAVRSRQ